MPQTKKRARPSSRARLKTAGISNRQTAAEERREREQFPPMNLESPPPEDAGGSIGEQGSSREGRQTSHKAGSRSVAQKMAGSKYSDRSTPSSHKVAGAYAKERASRTRAN
jgi:hypothetical protein